MDQVGKVDGKKEGAVLGMDKGAGVRERTKGGG